MKLLSWELSVLARAIAFSSLSAASRQIGMSQPQLTRTIQKLEDELKVTLLNRESRKKSGWTPEAYKLVENYTKTLQFWERSLNELNPKKKRDTLRIATLGGLLEIARAFALKSFQEFELQTVVVDVLDLDWLESAFLKADYDLILTVREPARRKFKFVKTIGYQNLQTVRKQGVDVEVLSSFEYQSTLTKEARVRSRKMVSNSLSFRKSWIEQCGGVGKLPSEVRKKPTRSEGEDEVLWVGADSIRDEEWKQWF